RPATGPDRWLALDLLERAGWRRAVLDGWADEGIVLELYDPADGQPCGAAVVDRMDEATYQLRAWAITVDPAEASVDDGLVAAILNALRRSGGRRVVASVGDANPDRLTVLLRAGFRFVSVERDAPGASSGRPRDASRDLVWMDQDL